MEKSIPTPLPKKREVKTEKAEIPQDGNNQI